MTFNALALTLAGAVTLAQHTGQMHTKPDNHDALHARGAKTMGFDQSLAAHHFTLLADGGSIDIQVVDARDEVTRKKVAAHLDEIRAQFKSGNFGTPEATHAEMPDGTAAMARLRDAIDYAVAPSARGAALRITARTPEALEAVHAFLRYQIREHRTGDPLTIGR
jgi:hypothetical protein